MGFWWFGFVCSFPCGCGCGCLFAVRLQRLVWCGLFWLGGFVVVRGVGFSFGLQLCVVLRCVLLSDLVNVGFVGRVFCWCLDWFASCGFGLFGLACDCLAVMVVVL